MVNYAETANVSTIVPVAPLPPPNYEQKRTTGELSPVPSSSYAIGPIDPAQLTTLPVQLSTGKTCSLLLPPHVPSFILEDPEFKEGCEVGYLDGDLELEWSVPQLVNWTLHTIENELSYEEAWESLGLHLPA